VHFHVSNEFGDWDTIHHTFTYTNAVDQAMRRAPSRELARGIFDGAMSVYLERFLNVPKQPLPAPAVASFRRTTCWQSSTSRGASTRRPRLLRTCSRLAVTKTSCAAGACPAA
jgi:hypothetical protein